MKEIQYQIPLSSDNGLPAYYRQFYPDSRLLFMDIETTGFSAQNTTLYLIGALWYETDTLKITQWFNDDGRSEQEILTSFHAFCGNFSHLVHFNGLGFDIPYLNQKSTHYQLPYAFDREFTHIDIYKEIRSYRKICSLDSMKQTAIEDFLGIKRKDTYTGKELIHIYQTYVAKQEEESEHLLLLHNHDDLLGMPDISKILHYKAFFEKPDILSVTSEQETDTYILHFTIPETRSLPKRISFSHNGMYLNALGQKASLHIPVITGTLRHYFTDYKNYYYLPQEDTAVHKSVAVFVEPENRQKATKKTCYIKRDGAFIPCMNASHSETFKYGAEEKETYQTLESVLQSHDLQTDYIRLTLKTFL